MELVARSDKTRPSISHHGDLNSAEHREVKKKKKVAEQCTCADDTPHAAHTHGVLLDTPLSPLPLVPRIGERENAERHGTEVLRRVFMRVTK